MIEKTVPPSVTTEDTNGSSVAAGSPAASKKGKKDKKDDKMPNSMNCKFCHLRPVIHRKHCAAILTSNSFTRRKGCGDLVPASQRLSMNKCVSCHFQES